MTLSLIFSLEMRCLLAFGPTGPVPLPTSSPSMPRRPSILFHLHADLVQPGVPRGQSSREDLLEQDLHTR